MASAYTTAILLLANFLVLLPWPATSEFNLAPIFSPVFDNVCKEVECGKGRCKPSSNSSFFFTCECEAGWKQARSESDRSWGFLPCIIPNCSIDFSCTNAPAPAPETHKPANNSIFDPCYWADCGGGKCNKTSPFTYACECEENYYNLLNTTALPCYRDCALGTDCTNLGISISNRTSSSRTPSSLDKDSSKASSVAGGVFNWLIIMLMLLPMVIDI